MTFFAGCRENVVPESVPAPILISPLITKATDVDFEDGDRIGMTVLTEKGTYAENALMSYEEGRFEGDIRWYTDTESPATLAAYYPYDSSGIPEIFKVSTDQSKGIRESDLISGVKTGVYPTKNVVDMVFRHQMTKLHITVCNQTGEKISAVTLGSSIPVASVDIFTGTVTVDRTAAPEDIRACEVVSDTVWTAIVVPQTVAFDFKVTLPSGKVLSRKLKELEVVQSFQYSISAVVYPDDIKIVTSGQIQDWLEGGDIPGGDDPGPGSDFEEHLEDGYFIYHGDRYTVSKMDDGKWWMTSNMRYLPKGYSPSDNLDNVTAGVYFPIVVNSSATGAEFSIDEDVIASNGYLYQSEVALGLHVGDVTDVQQAKALEGAQGICPKGWHVPAGDDLVHLIGKIAGYPYKEGETEASGAYYDSSKGVASVELLNADGFNAAAYGAVSIIDNTKTKAALTGWLKANPDAITSGFMCGSSYASSTPADPSDLSKGYKNFQFWGMMPMTGNGSFNGSRLSYRIAAALRCVRDSDKQ